MDETRQKNRKAASKYMKKRMLYGIAGLVWGLAAIVGLVMSARMLLIIMALSLMASCLIFSYTSGKDAEYVLRNGDPEEEYQRKKAAEDDDSGRAIPFRAAVEDTDEIEVSAEQVSGGDIESVEEELEEEEIEERFRG
jgi:hypothetical protein